MTVAHSPVPPSRRSTAALIAHAERLCSARGQRFTPLRRRVLEAIAAASQPLGAYDILSHLAQERGRVAPPTVYRALDFLMAQGFVHRVHSRNAFVICCAAEAPHSAVLYLCRDCGRVIEVPCAALEDHVVAHAREVGFRAESLAIEVRGLCAACSNTADDEP